MPRLIRWYRTDSFVMHSNILVRSIRQKPVIHHVLMSPRDRWDGWNPVQGAHT